MTRRLPFYALVVLLFLAVFRNLAPDPDSVRSPGWYYNGRFYGDDLVMFLTGLAFAITLYRIMRRRNTIQRDAMHASIKDEHIEHHVHA